MFDLYCALQRVLLILTTNMQIKIRCSGTHGCLPLSASVKGINRSLKHKAALCYCFYTFLVIGRLSKSFPSFLNVKADYKSQGLLCSAVGLKCLKHWRWIVIGKGESRHLQQGNRVFAGLRSLKYIVYEPLHKPISQTHSRRSEFKAAFGSSWS